MASTLILIVKKIYIAIVRKFCFSETCFQKTLVLTQVEGQSDRGIPNAMTMR